MEPFPTDPLLGMLSFDEEQQDRATEALQLLEQANTHLTEGESDRALDTFSKCIELLRQLDPSHLPFMLDLALSQQASLCEERRDWERAYTSHEARLAEARSANNYQTAGLALRNMAFCRSETGRYAEAVTLLEESLALARQHEDAQHEAVSLEQLAAIHSARGDFAAAGRFHAQIADAAQLRADPQEEFEALVYHASSLVFEDRLEEAEKQLRLAMTLKEEANLDPTIDLALLTVLAYVAGLLCYARGRFEEAVVHWRSYLDAARLLARGGGQLDRRIEGVALDVLARGCAARGGDEAEAGVALAREGVTRAEELGNLLDRAASHETLAFALLRAGQLDDAAAEVDTALSQYEALLHTAAGDELTGIAMLDIHSVPYELQLSLAVAQGQPLAALAAAEASRGRILAGRLERQEDGQEAKSLSLEEIERIVEGTGSTVVLYAILYDALRILLPGRFKGRQATLEESLFIWVLRPGSVGVFRQVDLVALRQQSPTTSLFQHITACRGDLARQGAAEATVSAELPERGLRALYDLLITPIDDLLPDDPAEQVIFVPHGPLFLVPFGALEDATGRPFAARATVATAPSIATLDDLRQPTARWPWRGEEVLVVGVGDLDHAAVEAEEIATLFATLPVLGAAATPEVVLARLPTARLVHIASHSRLDHARGHERPGALELAPSGDDEGLLTALELDRLQLPAELLVLSACDTGRGRITGDGVVNLARALIIASGAPVVVSLWPVEDLSTALLMGRFYRHLLEGGPGDDDAESSPAPSPAVALRHAQLWLRELTVGEVIDTLRARRQNRHGGHPSTALDCMAPQILARLRPLGRTARPFASAYYWAPFVLVGA